MVLTIVALFAAISIVTFVQSKITNPELITCYFVEPHLVGQVLDHHSQERSSAREDTARDRA